MFPIPKKAATACALAFVFSACYGSYTAYAVYNVHDAKVYQKVVLEVKKVTEQINAINQQIALTRQQLYDATWGEISPMLEQMDELRTSYNDIRKGVSGIMSAEGDAEKLLNKTFNSWKDFDPKKESYKSMKNRMKQDQYSVQKVDQDTIKLINHLQKEIDASNKRVEKYQEKLKTAKGEKDVGQYNALIASETVYSQNLTNEITALQAKLEVVRNEQKRQEQDAKDKEAELMTNDFAKCSTSLRHFADKTDDAKTYCDTFNKLLGKKGWF